MIESSFSLITALIIIILVTGFGVYEVQLFNHHRSINQFSSGIQEFIRQVDLLPKLSDQGSFTSISLSVPLGYNLTFSNISDSLIITGNENITIKLSVDLINELTLAPGFYNLEVCYGEYFSEGDFVVAFK